MDLRSSKRGAYKVELPRENNKGGIMALAQAFVSYESTLASGARTPYYEPMQEALAESRRLQLAIPLSESKRKQASEKYKDAEDAAERIAGQIRNLLAAVFVQAPVMAEDWGLVVRQTGRSAGQILVPHGPQERLAFLEKYIHTESARPEAEQFRHPTLTEVTAVYEALVTQRQAREDAKQQRMRDNDRLNDLCGELFEGLRCALSYLMLTRYNRMADRQLAQWGFYVVARTKDNGGTTAADTDTETAA